MRKIIVLAGLLIGAALFTGTPAKAWVGCECVKLGAPVGLRARLLATA